MSRETNNEINYAILKKSITKHDVYFKAYNLNI